MYPRSHKKCLARNTVKVGVELKVNALVNAWKENINLMESTRCNKDCGKVKDAAAKHGQEKTVKHVADI